MSLPRQHPTMGVYRCKRLALKEGSPKPMFEVSSSIALQNLKALEPVSRNVLPFFFKLFISTCHDYISLMVRAVARIMASASGNLCLVLSKPASQRFPRLAGCVEEEFV
jgi:hypothetical protein